MGFSSGLTYTETISMVTEICCNCGIAFGMPSDFQQHCKSDEDKWFYCPNGHKQHYSESEATRLRKQLDKERKEYKDQLEYEQAKLLRETKERIEAERKLKRVHKGVCPCCNRSFANLANHMKTKHPELVDQFKQLSATHKKITLKLKE